MIPEILICKILNMRPARNHIAELNTCIAAKKNHGKFNHFNLLFFVKHRYRRSSSTANSWRRTKSYSTRRRKRWNLGKTQTYYKSNS